MSNTASIPQRPAMLKAFRLSPSRKGVDTLRRKAAWVRKAARRMGYGPDMCSIYDGLGFYGFSLYVWRFAFHVESKQA